MGEKVGIGAQLVHVEPVLLAVGQTAADERLPSRGGMSAAFIFKDDFDDHANHFTAFCT